MNSITQDFEGMEVESRYSHEEISDRYRDAARVSLDRLRAHEPPLRTLFSLAEQARADAGCDESKYTVALKTFKELHPSLEATRAFNTVSNGYYYGTYYYPSTMISAVCEAAYGIIRWADRYIIRSNVGSENFGVTVGADWNRNIPGASFGQVVTCLRHHASHFEDWVEKSTPSGREKTSWDTLQQLGYPTPLRNVSVIEEAFWKMSASADEWLCRLRGAVTDLAHVAQCKGSTPLDSAGLYERFHAKRLSAPSRD